MNSKDKGGRERQMNLYLKNKKVTEKNCMFQSVKRNNSIWT